MNIFQRYLHWGGATVAGAIAPKNVNKRMSTERFHHLFQETEW
jgi:hypothetical protein